jgi:outer membrane protein assembly factor BamE (lipoprotein component of BamABCDE complex)
MRYCLLLIFSLLLLSGCATKVGCDKEKNLANLPKLRVGMTKEQVLKVMGSPIKDESYAKPDYWYYFTNTVLHDNLVTEDECAVLVFEKGILKGWGNKFYSEFRQANIKDVTSVKK